MLYTCYDLIKPDVALEAAWRQGNFEYVVPYFIQFVKELSSKVSTVEKKTDDIKKKEEQKQEEAMQQPLDVDVGFMFPGTGMGMQQNAMPAIMPQPGSMQGMGGVGGQMGGQMNMGGNMGGGMGGFQQPRF
jgi:clathrin heavy chain